MLRENNPVHVGRNTDRFGFRIVHENGSVRSHHRTFQTAWTRARVGQHIEKHDAELGAWKRLTTKTRKPRTHGNGKIKVFARQLVVSVTRDTLERAGALRRERESSTDLHRRIIQAGLGQLEANPDPTYKGFPA